MCHIVISFIRCDRGLLRHVVIMNLQKEGEAHLFLFLLFKAEVFWYTNGNLLKWFNKFIHPKAVTS